eukprot:5537101-Prymnesium_polylepis.2
MMIRCEELANVPKYSCSRVVSVDRHRVEVSRGNATTHVYFGPKPVRSHSYGVEAGIVEYFLRTTSWSQRCSDALPALET